MSQLGYTRIPNTILEKMSEMTESELRVALAVARATLGWQKDSDRISLSQLTSATGMSRQGVLNGINGCIKNNTISRKKTGQNYIYSLVNEVDQSTKCTSQLSRPELVNEVDRQLVNEVDTQKKGIKERKERGVGSSEDQGNSEEPAQPTTPPPSFPKESNEPLLANGQPLFSDPRDEWSQRRYTAARDYPGIDRKLHVQLTNKLKEIRGYSALIDSVGSDALEDELQKEAYDCWQLGVADVGLMIEMHSKWLIYAENMNFDRKTTWKGQFYKFCVQVVSGYNPTPNQQNSTQNGERLISQHVQDLDVMYGKRTKTSSNTSGASGWESVF